jgi:hypothetical protein
MTSPLRRASYRSSLATSDSDQAHDGARNEPVGRLSLCPFVATAAATRQSFAGQRPQSLERRACPAVSRQFVGRERGHDRIRKSLLEPGIVGVERHGRRAVVARLMVVTVSVMRMVAGAVRRLVAPLGQARKTFMAFAHADDVTPRRPRRLQRVGRNGAPDDEDGHETGHDQGVYRINAARGSRLQTSAILPEARSLA